jgi:branched-chain amino acid transport system substrate-binding protein
MKIFTIIILKIIFFYSTFVSAEVKIAALYAESGPVSEIAEAKRVAVEKINADGIGIVGRGLISIDTIDTGCDSTKTEDSLNAYLKNNDPEILLGPTCSTSAVKVIQQATIPDNILTISSSASYPLLSTIEDNDLFFRTIPSDIQQSTSIANYLLSKNIREIILLYGDDNYNSTLAQNFLKVFTEQEGIVLFNTLLTDKTLINQQFINTFVDIAIDNNQPGLVMFLHGNERTVNLLLILF